MPESWNDLQRSPASQPAASTEPAFDEICAMALSSAAGRELLKALRARYIDRPENPLLPEAALRVRVTQQQFVRDLESARDTGLAAMAARNKPSSTS